MKKMKNEERAPLPGGGSADKAEKFGWMVVDQRGVHISISKHALTIDPSYQRGTSNRRALQIAREWSWLACGAIVVAFRDDKFYVVDGGHRVAAALKRSDIDELDCLVFETETVAQEAAAFLRGNKMRSAVRAVDQFRAALASGDELALSVNAMLKRHGRAPLDYSSPNGVACLSTIMRLAARSVPRLEVVFAAVSQLYNGRRLSGRAVDALFYIDECLIGDSISSRRFRDRLFAIGAASVEEAMSQAAAFYACGGPKVFAAGIIERMNKGLRNRFTLGAPEDHQ